MAPTPRRFISALRSIRTLAVICGISWLSVSADAAPPVINSVTPNSVIQNTVPQPTITITGNGFVVGLPSSVNRPTVTLRLNGEDLFSTLGYVNFSGTTITLPPGNNQLNLLQAPLGAYDVIVSRPDGESATLPAAFSITLDQPKDVNIKYVTSWGGPVNDVDVVGDLAYIANGRVLRVLNIADPANPANLGSIDLIAVSGVRVRNGYAFVAAKHPYRFCVVDVSDPANLRLVWTAYGATADFPEDVRLHGNLAFVRSGLEDIDVFDVTDPENAVFLRQINVNGSAMEIANDQLYVGTNSSTQGGGATSELRIYDLAANPLVPPLLGSVASPDGWWTTGISVEGDHAAWTVINRTFGTPSLFMVDASNPVAPAIVGAYSDFNSFYESASAANTAMSGGFVYVADQSNTVNHSLGKGLAVFNAADPANPVLVGNYKPHGSVRGVRVIGERAYLFDEGEGLIIMDVSSPANPVRLGNYHSPSTLRRMVKVGDLLYMADAWNGFTILNVADPVHPDVVGVYLADHFNDLGVNAWGIVLQDNKVYLGAGHLGLEVVDVSNPAAPAFLGAFRVPPPLIPIPPECEPHAHFSAVGLSGSTAHITLHQPCLCGATMAWINYFITLDVANPQTITELGRVLVGECDEGTEAPTTIALNSQGHAFISRTKSLDQPIWGEGRRYVTVDTSHPANPGIIHVGDVLPTVDLALDGNTLYIANNHNDNWDTSPGLYVQDVSDPVNPVTLSHVNENYGGGQPFRSAYAVAVQNGRLYASGLTEASWESIYLFDVANPSTPVYLDRSAVWGGDGSSPSASTSLLVDEPYAYSAFAAPKAGFDISEGLAIHAMDNLPLPPSPADIAPPGGDGVVNVNDLLAVILAWGPCPAKGACDSDIAPAPDSDGFVNVNDLLMVISNWG